MNSPSTALAPMDLRSEFAELVRSRIRQSAMELFAAQGYRATTIRQIAKSAGTTHTTLYKYYRSKASVIYGILREIAPDVRAYYVQIENFIDDRKSFDLWFDRYCAFWVAHRGIYQAFWEAAIGDAKIALWMLQETEGLLEPLMGKLMRATTLPPGVVRKRVALWLLGVDQLLSFTHVVTPPADRKQAVQAVASMLWGSLCQIRADGGHGPDAPAQPAGRTQKKSKHTAPRIRRK